MESSIEAIRTALEVAERNEAEHEAEARRWHDAAAAIRLVVADLEGTSVLGAAAPVRALEGRYKSGKRQSISPTIRAFMETTGGRRIHVREVVEALRAAGIPMNQKTPNSTVANALGRMADDGLARKFPDNYWEWIVGEGEQTVAEHVTEEPQVRLAV